MQIVKSNEKMLKDWGKKGWKLMSYYINSIVKYTVDVDVKYEIFYPISSCMKMNN